MDRPKPNTYTSIIKSAKFARWYAIGGLSVLLATTIWWSTLTAKIHTGNADQLVNVFLFDDPATFHEAVFPSAHTFLIKWPLFLLVKLFGSSGTAFIFFTVAITVITVGLLTYFLYRIERRPLFFGTICLALASVLLLVPPQSYAGALLPVNMAMLTTRNLEYIFYIASLAILARLPTIKSLRFWSAAGLLFLLCASDNLFIYLSIGGACLALGVYTISRQWHFAKLSAKWLLASTVAGVSAVGLLWVLNNFGIVQLSSDPGTGPYGFVNTIKDAAIGCTYAVLGIFTNLGANPAFDATIIKNIPSQTIARLLGVGGVTFIMNAVMLVMGLFAAYRLTLASFFPKKDRNIKPAPKLYMSLMLVYTTIAAITVFTISDHYYPVDARYLGISLFALFICIATFSSYKKGAPHKIVMVGGIITIGIVLGLVSMLNIYNDSTTAMADTQARNTSVAGAIKNHPVDVFAADYWRALPIRLQSNNTLLATPLETCDQARNVLSSKKWQLDLNRHSFAYLLTLDGHLADSPDCTLNQVINQYDRPNASVVIAGTPTTPKELLLFYDRGARKSAPRIGSDAQKNAVVAPLDVNQLGPKCDGPTIMNIVAHQDDDLLFTSPDLLHDIRAGHCIRTVYVTAGDAGNGPFYWLKREQGSEAAYSYLLGSNTIWSQRIVQLADHQFVTIANPKGNSKISLIFMHLPDGEPTGKGFSTSHHESLQKLWTNKITTMQAVTNDSSYTSRELTDALQSLMQAFKPDEIRTQASFISHRFPDHSDHMATGEFTKRAYDYYKETNDIPIKFYTGYPVHQMPQNVTGDDLLTKEAAFLKYATFDGGVCQTAEECNHTATYNAYLQRQYQDYPSIP